MKNHLRVDSVKVFEEDALKLELLQKAHGIKGKGEAYRKAVDFMLRYHELYVQNTMALKELTKAVNDGNAKTDERLEDLYFKINTINAHK
ncbi:capsule polysaccharide export protein KpsE/RkpR [Massilia sp. UYP11]|uniref:hypothetical protein n=1 Tax=Massilia sp. UYP11 TaxID=1756385 RepID=UPI003D2416F5